MGLQGITINTEPGAEPHIYAEEDAAIYESIVGADGVFSIGQKCKATILSNNQVRVADGVICIGGHFARIPYGDYEDVSIANGQSGYNRNDIIIGKIVSTGIRGIDTMTCEVKQGVAAATASDPALVQDNLYEGGKVREIPLYRVKIEGLSIVAVEQLFEVIPTIPQILEELAKLNSKINESHKALVNFDSGNGSLTITKNIGNVHSYKAFVINLYYWYAVRTSIYLPLSALIDSTQKKLKSPFENVECTVTVSSDGTVTCVMSTEGVQCGIYGLT